MVDRTSIYIAVLDQIFHGRAVNVDRSPTAMLTECNHHHILPPERAEMISDILRDEVIAMLNMGFDGIDLHAYEYTYAAKQCGTIVITRNEIESEPVDAEASFVAALRKDYEDGAYLPERWRRLLGV